MRLAVLAVLLLALPGCLGPAQPQDSTSAAPTTALDDRLVIGLVLTDELLPLVGATVSQVGTTRSTTTNETGEFRLGGLPAQDGLEIRASMGGYAPTTTLVDLRVVTQTELRLILAPEAVEPRHVTIPFSARIECQAYAGQHQGATSPLRMACDTPLAPNRIVTTVPFEPGIEWAVIELYWYPKNQASRNMDLGVDLVRADSSLSLGHKHSDHDIYYIRIIPLPTLLEEVRPTGAAFRSYISVDGSIMEDHFPVNAALALEQDLRHYTTSFYGGRPSVFWTAVR